MGPLKAMDLLLSLPISGASNHLCHEVNPNLWFAWCEEKKRDPHQTSDVWTELDVAVSAEMMLRQYIRDRIIGERS